MLLYHLLTILACLERTWAGQTANTALANTTAVATVSNDIPIKSFHDEKGGGHGGGDGSGDGGDGGGDSGGSGSTSSGGKAPAGSGGGADSGVARLSSSKWLVTGSLLGMAANQQYGPIVLLLLVVRTFVEARSTSKASVSDALPIACAANTAPVKEHPASKERLDISTSWLLTAVSASALFLFHDKTALLAWYIFDGLMGLAQAGNINVVSETPSPTEVVQYDISGIPYTTAWSETTIFTTLSEEPTLESTIGELLTIYPPDSTATSEVVGVDPSDNVVVVFGQGTTRKVSWYLPSSIFFAMAALYFGIFPMIILGILRFADAAQLETIDQALQQTQSSRQGGLSTGAIIGIVDGTLAAAIILWVGSAAWRAGWSWDGTLRNLYIRPWPPWSRRKATVGAASTVALMYLAGLPLLLFGMLGLTNAGFVDGRDLAACQAQTPISGLSGETIAGIVIAVLALMCLIFTIFSFVLKRWLNRHFPILSTIDNQERRGSGDTAESLKMEKPWVP